MREKLNGGARYLRSKRRSKIWKNVVISLAAVVVFCTTYALILPALTMSRENQSLNCQAVCHVHNTECYGENGDLTCGKADYMLHAHESSCYDDSGDLVCPLPERIPHEHDSSCYMQSKELACGLVEDGEHEHTDACLDPENGDYTCGFHVHNEDCWYVTEILSCTNPDVPHHHLSECYNDEGTLVCGQLELMEHIHGNGCFVQHEEAEPEKPTQKKEEKPASDDTVNGTVVAYSGAAKSSKTLSMHLMALGTGDPVVVNPYVVPSNEDPAFTRLLYKVGNGEWTEVTSGTTIPGDAKLRLEIVYENVPVDALIAGGGQLTYTMPSYMKNIAASGNINAGTAVVGHIAANEAAKSVTITFEEDFLNELKNTNKNLLSGTFFAEGDLDLGNIPENGDGTLVLGDVTIDVHFENDIVAKHGEVTTTKTVGSKLVINDEGVFLDYTISVTAGPAGAPQVKVADYYTDIHQRDKYVKEYIGVTGTSQSIADVSAVTETGAPANHGGRVYLGRVTKDSSGQAAISEAGANATKPGTLIWDIGDMKPNETRTLTYRVKLDNNYIGVQTKGALKNAADTYSMSYPKPSDDATFNPYLQFNEKKTATDMVKNEDGSFTITYTVYVKANPNNSYTLTNVSIFDQLDSSANMTQKKYWGDVHYVDGSFRLYQGNGTGGTQLPTPVNPHAGESNPHMYTSHIVDADLKMDVDFTSAYSYYIGELAPGAERTLSYQITVDPEFLIHAGNDVGTVKNIAYVCYDNTRDDATTNAAQSATANRDIQRKVWDRKIVGEQNEANLPITMNQYVYENVDGTYEIPTDTPGSFTVPAGSYKYTVVVNEAGDWDVSSANMKDTLEGIHMEFTGYVRVDAYEISGTAAVPGGTDQQVVSNLSARTPNKTVWVKVDGETSFNFTAHDIGLGDGQYAIMMTYYAQPVNMEGITNVFVTNTFTLEGTVGVGGHYYILDGIEVHGDMLLTGSNHFAAEKLAWYYDKNATGNYAPRGALYWAIKIKANMIPAGTVIQDVTPSGQNGDFRGNRLFMDSVVGVYRGSLNQDITEYRNWESAAEGLTLINSSNYEVTIPKKEHELHVKFKNDITLAEGEDAYIILRTNPGYVPTGKREVYYFNNTIQHKFEEESDWISDNTATHTLYGSENILKELNSVFTWDGSRLKNVQTGKGGTVITAGLERGTYVAWNIKINYMGNLEGRYTITDHVPEGMELVYARIKWVGEGHPDCKNDSHVFTPEKTDLGPEWQPHSITAVTDNKNSSNVNVTRTTPFYTKGSDVCWDLDTLIAGNAKDIYSIDCQVLCRVTDEDVLLGNQEKTFNNTVDLTTSDGRNIGSDSDGINVKVETLSKAATYSNVDGGRYPYKITLNPLGEDLVEGSNTLTLVDEMSPSLVLDVSSIVVKNTNTNAVLSASQYTVSVEGQTLKITLPDNQPLTVTYTTIIQAAPGVPVTIGNSAHWEGYAVPEHGSTGENDFSYEAGGTVTVADYPWLTIVKSDQYNTNLKLSGAKFTVTEMELVSGTLREMTDGHVWTDCTTGVDGTVEVGRDATKLMLWNTIYRIVETQAPDGYVLDDTPRYFAVAKKVDGAYPAQLAQFENAGVTVFYLDAEYTYQAYNHKGEAVVTKIFKDSDDRTLATNSGTYRFAIYEVNGTTETMVGNPQTLRLGSGNNDNTVSFKNLDMSKTYRIYELDDNNQPIRGGDAGMVNGMLFDVTYTDADVSFGDGETVTQTEITNKLHVTSLPETGSTGVTGLYLAGFTMMAFATVLLVLKKREYEI